MVPLGSGGFLPHLDFPRAPFSVSFFTSFSLPTWDPCLRLGLYSVSLMLTIYRLTSTALRVEPSLRTAVETIGQAVESLQAWMSSNRLRLNPRAVICQNTNFCRGQRPLLS